MIKQDKPSDRIQTRKETKSRRSSMVIKVLSFNIQKNKLSKDKKFYLKTLFLEAKYYYNYLIYLSQQSVTDNYGNTVYPNNLFDFNTKSNQILVYEHSSNSYLPYELKFLSSQVKQELLKKIQSSIKSLSKAKTKGRKIGQLKFKSFVNLPFKQFNNSFYLSDNAKKLSLQGNKKSSFHLVRNKNLSQLSKELKLQDKNQISLKKLIDLKIIEIANAELASSYKKDNYKFNLTVYFNPQYLKKANLFQGTKLSVTDHALISQLTLGLDAGIASEQTINIGETYASISINSRNPVNKAQSNKLKKLKHYQRKLNRHIAKSKKHKKLNKDNNKNNIRNNDKGFYTGKFKELKQQINFIQDNLNNHKTDSIAKITSIYDLFAKITFQDEMVKSWHKNKKMKFSSPIQKGILGKVYAKLKNNYDNENNQTIINGKTHYKYQKLSRSLRTTKTCVCGNVNQDITLKDRVYVCSQCGYENDRDTHSSYMINNTLNHIEYNLKDNTNLEYQQEEALGCGMQSKDWDLKKDLILNSNLGQTITSAKTEQVFNILSSKLKSNNLFIKLNNYSMDKSNQEASSFRAR